MLTVLFVDDDKYLLNSFRRILHSHCTGYRFHFATSGAEAIEISKRVRPDVLITDSCMPGMDGTELIRAMKISNPELNSILMSGSILEEETGRSGDFRYLRKPCSMDKLLKVLEEFNS